MSLILDVSSLEREVGQVLRFELRGSAPEGAEPLTGVRFGPISVEGRAMWTGETVLVEGRARAEGDFTCSRCCRPFSRLVSAEFARQFSSSDETRSWGAGGPGQWPGRSRPAGPGGPERDAPSLAHASPHGDDAGRDSQEDEPPLPFDDQRIDLAFAAWEALALELPMKPICRVECAGLCPVCGNDLNEGACGCQAKKADSRFLSLKKLLEAKERGE